MPFRSGVSTPLRISCGELFMPKIIVPSLADPRPQAWQNSVPTGAMVGVNQASGSTGFGPSWLVFRGGGGGWEHVSLGPHPKFAPFAIRLISSLHSGPFSVSHRFPVIGSKVKPNEFRWP